MALLWYRDPADGALKPYAVPGEELSFTTYEVLAQVVPSGTAWVQVGPPEQDPIGDDIIAWAAGEWTAPAGGVWQVEFRAHTPVNIPIAARIVVEQEAKAFVQSSPGGLQGENGVGVTWVGEIPGGTVLTFWVNHGNTGVATIAAVITATRHRRYTPQAGSLAAVDEGVYVLKAGDTMEGPLLLAGDPALSTAATTKSYVDGKVQDAVWDVGTTVAPSQKSVNDALLDILALEVGAGGGLTGGEVIGSSPYLSVGEAWGITVGEDAVGVDQGELDTRYARVDGGNAAGNWPINAASVDGFSFRWGDDSVQRSYVLVANAPTDVHLYPTGSLNVNNATHWEGRRMNWSGQGVLEYYLMSSDGTWFYPVHRTAHSHGRGSAGYNPINVHVGVLGAGSSYGWTWGHGLGYSPAMICSDGNWDDGAHSIDTSCGSWDGTNVNITAKNSGGANEDCNIGAVAFG